jgi:tetratricopeptide (TPR) repeat protein
MDRITLITEQLASSPDDPFLQHALALEHIKLGDDATARGYFEHLLAKTPGYVGSYYHLGKLLERMGFDREAASIYEKGMTAAREAGETRALGELRSAYEELTM